jgi:hypothetical protein
MTEEDFENQNDRLLEAEGRIFALTHLVRELLSVSDFPKEDINTYLTGLHDAIAPDEETDEPTLKFIEAARALFGQLISGEPPTRPTFTVIRGGKS